MLTTNDSSAMRFGFGQHETALDPDMARKSMKVLYVVQLFYVSAINSVKIALLLTYARIWTTWEFRRRWYSVGTIIALVWCISMFITIFQCHPIHFFWDHEPGGSCLKSEPFFIGMSIPNTILDLVVLSIPQPSIWQLQLPRMQKAGLTVVFGVGVM